MSSIPKNLRDKQPPNSCSSVRKWKSNLLFYILFLLVQEARPSQCIRLVVGPLCLNTVAGTGAQLRVLI
jgi:hypothetical protein